MKLRFVSTKKNVFDIYQIYYIDVLPLTYHHFGRQYMKLNRRQIAKIKSFLMKHHGYVNDTACCAIENGCITPVTLVEDLSNSWVYKLW